MDIRWSIRIVDGGSLAVGGRVGFIRPTPGNWRQLRGLIGYTFMALFSSNFRFIDTKY